jgi:hypothetical protein
LCAKSNQLGHLEYSLEHTEHRDRNYFLEKLQSRSLELFHNEVSLALECFYVRN